MKIDNLFNFSALATSDLFVCLTCIPRGIRTAMKVTYFRGYPIVEFFNQFSYTASIFLTATMIVHRYLVFARHIKGSKGEQGFSRIKWIITVVVFATQDSSFSTSFISLHRFCFLKLIVSFFLQKYTKSSSMLWK